MNEIYHALNELITTLRSINASEAAVLSAARNLCNSCKYISLIRDMDTNLICHTNKAAEDYFGITQKEAEEDGFSFSRSVLHPDFVQAQALVVNYFTNPESYQSVYEYMYYVTTVKGWMWTYICSQAFYFRKDGSPRFVIAVAADVNDIINNTISNSKLVADIKGFSNIEYEKYQSLSKREVELLGMISKEMTSEEIAKELILSKSTVDTHRKSLLKKLNVKSAIGMAKYYFLFHPDN